MRREWAVRPDHAPRRSPFSGVRPPNTEHRTARTENQTMTRVRYQVLAFAVALAAVTYLDRVCISRAEGEIRRDLGLTKLQMSFVFGAFTIAYALFEIPTGAWGDRIGA